MASGYCGHAAISRQQNFTFGSRSRQHPRRRRHQRWPRNRLAIESVRPRLAVGGSAGGGTAGNGAAGFAAGDCRFRTVVAGGGALVTATGPGTRVSTSRAVALDQTCSDPQAGHFIRTTTGFSFWKASRSLSTPVETSRPVRGQYIAMKPPMVSPYALLPPYSKARLGPKVKGIARLLGENPTSMPLVRCRETD